jgi:hypothetical protein
LQIVIEIEDRQINAAHVADPQQHVLLSGGADIGMETNNLLVEAFFVPSVLAHQDGEDRLVRYVGKALGFAPVGVPDRFRVVCCVGRARRLPSLLNWLGRSLALPNDGSTAKYHGEQD